MAGPFFHVGAVAMCPHGAPVTTISSNARVMVSGMPVALLPDQYLVAGCPFTVPPGVPQPCFQVQWFTSTVRVLIDGTPAITQASTGIVLAVQGIPNGPPLIVSTQPRVSAT